MGGSDKCEMWFTQEVDFAPKPKLSAIQNIKSNGYKHDLSKLVNWYKGKNMAQFIRDILKIILLGSIKNTD